MSKHFCANKIMFNDLKKLSFDGFQFPYHNDTFTLSIFIIVLLITCVVIWRKLIILTYLESNPKPLMIQPGFLIVLPGLFLTFNLEIVVLISIFFLIVTCLKVQINHMKHQVQQSYIDYLNLEKYVTIYSFIFYSNFQMLRKNKFLVESPPGAVRHFPRSGLHIA